MILYMEIIYQLYFLVEPNGRSASQQGLYQLAALGTTLTISIFGGLITGFIVKNLAESTEYFEDNENWGYEEENQLETAI